MSSAKAKRQRASEAPNKNVSQQYIPLRLNEQLSNQQNIRQGVAVLSVAVTCLLKCHFRLPKASRIPHLS